MVFMAPFLAVLPSRSSKLCREAGSPRILQHQTTMDKGLRTVRVNSGRVDGRDTLEVEGTHWMGHTGGRDTLYS